MIWSNLKANKCPQCNKVFGLQSFTKKPGYIICSCEFGISQKRYSEIVNSQVTAGLEEKYLEEEDDKLG